MAQSGLWGVGVRLMGLHVLSQMGKRNVLLREWTVQSEKQSEKDGGQMAAL